MKVEDERAKRLIAFLRVQGPWWARMLRIMRGVFEGSCIESRLPGKATPNASPISR